MRLEEVGLGLSISGAVTILSTVPLGRLIDRIGPKAYLVCASLVSAAAYATVPLVNSVLSLALALGVAGGAFSAGWPALQSVIGSIASDNRTTVLGTLRSVRNIGYALAGVIIGLAIWMPARPGVFLVAGLATFSYLVSAAVYGRVTMPARAPRDAPTEGRRPRISASYVGLMLASTVFAFGTIILDIGFPLWLTRSESVPTYLAGAALIVNTLLVIIAQPHAANLSNTIRRARLGLVLSASCFVASYAVMFGIDSFGLLAFLGVVVATVLFTAGEILESAAWWTVSYELAPAAVRNEHLSFFSLNYQIVAAVGPLAVAAALSQGAIGWLYFAAASALAGICAFALLAGRQDGTS